MVKKEGYLILIGMCLLLIPLISAGLFSNFFEKITGTGRATQGVELNLTVGTVSITHVFNESMTDVSGGLNSGSSINGGLHLARSSIFGTPS